MKSRDRLEIGDQMSVRGSVGGAAPLYFPSRVVLYDMPLSNAAYCTALGPGESEHAKAGEGVGSGGTGYGILLWQSNADVHRGLVQECLCHPGGSFGMWGSPGFSPLFC